MCFKVASAQQLHLCLGKQDHHLETPIQNQNIEDQIEQHQITLLPWAETLFKCSSDPEGRKKILPLIIAQFRNGC